MTTDTTQPPRTPGQELVATVRSNAFMEQIRVALPGNVTAERFARATVTALMQTPELATADHDSLLQSVVKCAQDGLLPDGREAALVIFNSKVKINGSDTWVKKVQYLPMVGGFRKIAAEHGWTLTGHVVYEHDEFDYQVGSSELPYHKAPRLGHARGKAIGAWAKAVHTDSRVLFDVLDLTEIEKVRQVSRAKDSGPWKDWTDRMWEKTAVRRLFKSLPLGEREEARVARVLDATALTPAAAAAALYGPGATPALPPGPVDGGGGAHGPDVTGPGNQQAAAADEAGYAAEAAAVPDADDHDEKIRQAGIVIAPDGQFEGKTLNELLDLEGGRGWLWYALRLPKYKGKFREALELHVESQLPDLWNVYQAWQEAGSPVGEDFETWANARKDGAA